MAAEDEDFDHWMATFEKIDQTVNQLTRKAGFDAQKIAQEESRIDTGAMKNGWYVRTEDSSNRATPTLEPGMYLFPEVPATEHNEVWLVGGLGHTLFNELGTSHMPAKPMAAPALARVRQPYLDALKKVVEG